MAEGRTVKFLDDEEEIYDNEAPEPEAEYEEEVYDNDPTKELTEDDEIYDNNEPLDTGEEIYDNDAPQNQALDMEEEIYDNDAPQNQADEIYDDTPLQPTVGSDDEGPAQGMVDEIYEAPEIDEGENYESPLVTQSINQPSTPQPQPPSDYRAIAVENLAQQSEPMPGKTQDIPLSQDISPERESLNSSGSLRRNPCLGFYNCTHSEEFSDLTTCEKTLYVMGFLMSTLWILLVIPVVAIAVISGVQSLGQGDASIAPDCGEYSIALLLAAIVTNIFMALFLICWLLRGSCNCCQGKRANRSTLSSLCVLALIYIIIVVGFSASILAFASETRNVSISSNSTIINITISGSGSGGLVGSGDNCNNTEGSGINKVGSGSGQIGLNCNNTTPERREVSCVEFSNQPFLLAMVFLGLLVIFLVAVLLLLWFECSYNGCCYKREIYDPTVVVIQNQSTF